MENKDKKYPEGHFLSQGIAVGLPIGIAIGLAIGNIALGPAIGVSFGVAIGVALENKHKKEGKVRPLTEKEKQNKYRNLIVLSVIGVIAFVVILLTYFGS